MRRLSSVVAVVAAVPAFVALPVFSRPAPHVHPVAPHLAALSVAPTPALSGLLADTGPRPTSQFDLVGATWSRGTLAAATTLQVRTRSHGRWSGWSSLGLPDGGPDGGSADARSVAAHARPATDPLWVGDSDGVQARVVDRAGHAGRVPAGLQLVLVDGGSSAADASPGPARPVGGDVAMAAEAQPTIYTRAQWGADESLRLHACPKGPDYSPTIKMGFIHHTDGANGYSESQVPSIIRSIYAYHVKSNGWCDVGYNFLVDRFGRIWEGRYGGITRPVIGAHTGGYNFDTFAASLIGNFGSTRPNSAMLDAVERLFAWKLGSYYLDPTAKATLVAGSFSGSRYPSGSHVTFNLISGHRNADFTSCPGDAAYADLGAIRRGVLADMGAGLVAPSVRPASAQMGSGASIVAAAHVLTDQTWALTVTDAQGLTLKTLTGSAGATTPIRQAWDLTDVNGLPVPPGTYTVTLSSQNAAGVAAVPFSTTVTVTPPVTASAPDNASYQSTVTLGGTALPNAAVAVQLTDVAANAPQPVQTVQASSTGAWSTTFVADRDWSWTATVDGYTTKPGTTRVAPTITSPPPPADGRVFIRAGDSVGVGGTGLPGTSVSLVTKQPGGPSSSVVTADVPVGADGKWSDPSPLTPSVPTSLAAQDSRGLASAAYVVYPVSAATASAPSAGWAGRSVSVSGNAGNAPVQVSLWAKPPGSSAFTLVRQVAAGATGGFAVRLPLPAVTAHTTLPWQVTTDFGPAVSGAVDVAPTFVPTATGPRRVAYDARRWLHGTAVPGDPVTLWRRFSGSHTWVRVGRATASSEQTWSIAYRFTRDTAWRVTSRSGTSATVTTLVVPTIKAPSTVAPRALVRLYGVALPWHRLTLYRQVVGGSTWTAVKTLPVPRTGAWNSWRRLGRSLRFYVVCNGRRSRVVTVTVA